MILLPAVVEAVSDDKTIVMGAGGYCDGKTLAASLMLGADGAQMGTRFLSTEESDFAPLWKQSVVDCPDRGTIVARGFVGPARWLKNARSDQHAINTMKISPGLFLGIPDDSTAPEDLKKLLDYEDESIEAVLSNDKTKAMMAVGECAQRINDMPKVADLVKTMVSEAEAVLKKAPSFVS
jgi:enoyl-[acyl-carrier protein] reductase II